MIGKSTEEIMSLERGHDKELVMSLLSAKCGSSHVPGMEVVIH